MPLFFIETLVGETRCPDRIGTVLADSGAAVKTALSALIDIAHDESDAVGDMDVSICVQDFGGRRIFSGIVQTLRGGRASYEAEPLSEAEERPRLAGNRHTRLGLVSAPTKARRGGSGR